MLINCAGAYIRLKGGKVDVHCPGNISIKSAGHSFSGPTSLKAPAPEMPQAKEPYSEQFEVKDKHTGELMVYTPYRLELPNGKIIRGITDGQGRTVRVFANSMHDVKLFLGK